MKSSEAGCARCDFFTTGMIFEQYDASEILSKIYN